MRRKKHISSAVKHKLPHRKTQFNQISQTSTFSFYFIPLSKRWNPAVTVSHKKIWKKRKWNMGKWAPKCGMGWEGGIYAKKGRGFSPLNGPLSSAFFIDFFYFGALERRKKMCVWVCLWVCKYVWMWVCLWVWLTHKGRWVLCHSWVCVCNGDRIRKCVWVCGWVYKKIEECKSVIPSLVILHCVC